MINMSTIILITLKEIVRRRMLLVTIFLTTAFLALYGAGVHYGYKDVAGHAGTLKALLIPQFLLLGLYFGSFIIAFLAVMIAVGSVSSEIENGIMHTVATRPVRRSEIILGKFLGYGMLLTAFAILFYLAVLLIVRCNTGADIPIKAGSLGLFCLQPLILLALTMFGTTFLSTLANGISAFMLYAVGVIGGMLEQIGYLSGSQILVDVGIISSLVMPADSVYRKIVYHLLSGQGLYALGPFGSGAEPSIWMLAYTLFYILIFLVLALIFFSKRDI